MKISSMISGGRDRKFDGEEEDDDDDNLAVDLVFIFDKL